MVCYIRHTLLFVGELMLSFRCTIDCSSTVLSIKAQHSLPFTLMLHSPNGTCFHSFFFFPNVRGHCIYRNSITKYISCSQAVQVIVNSANSVPYHSPTYPLTILSYELHPIHFTYSLTQYSLSIIRCPY